MSSSGVRSVHRAIEILELLAARHDLTVTEIGRELDIPKATAHQILATLVAKRVLTRGPGSETYALGPNLFTLGSYARLNFDVVRVAAPHLRRLNELLDETIHLTVLRDGKLLYVDCYESTKRLRTHSSIGEIGDLHCTAVGKAVLAFQPPDDRRRLIGRSKLDRFTPNTIVDPVELEAELERVVERGYAVDDIEHEAGVRCVAAPIRNHDGRVIASLSVSGPDGRITPDRFEPLARDLIRTADDVSRELGHAPGRPGGKE